jgi:hypothetical protein
MGMQSAIPTGGFDVTNAITGDLYTAEFPLPNGVQRRRVLVTVWLPLPDGDGDAALQLSAFRSLKWRWTWQCIPAASVGDILNFRLFEQKAESLGGRHTSVRLEASISGRCVPQFAPMLRGLEALDGSEAAAPL